MISNSNFRNQKIKIIECISKWFEIDVSDVPIVYIDNIEFYQKIKTNYKLSSEYYDNIEMVKERYKFFCEIIQGFYKWKEKKIFIKKEEKYNFSLLLVEFLHSKSIIQGKSYIKSWLREGLPHYLAKLLCYKCNIDYRESGYQIYFSLWEEILRKYNANVLKTIIYAEDIKISISILKSIFKYDKNNILEIPFEKAKVLLRDL